MAAVILAGLLCIIGLRKPALSFLLAILSVLMVKTLTHVVSGNFRNTDEILALCLPATIILRRFVRREPIRSFAGLKWLTAFAVVGLLGSVLNGGYHTGISGCFLAVKGALLALAAANCDWDQRALIMLARAWKLFSVILVLACAVNFVIPERWNSVFAESGRVDYRLGLPSLVGPFTHPGDLSVVAIILVAAIPIRDLFATSTRKRGLLSAAITATALLSLRVKSVLSLVGIWFIARRRRSSPLIASALVVAAAALLLNASIQSAVLAQAQDTISSSGFSPRGRLFFGALTIARQHFPLGSGFGTYGSFVSTVNYSAEYVRLGFDSIWGLNTQYGAFLTDTQWPALIAESGWLGTVFFSLSLVSAFQSLRPVTGQNANQTKVSMAFRRVMIAMLFASIALPAYYSPPANVFAFLGAAIAAHYKDFPEEDSIADS